MQVTIKTSIKQWLRVNLLNWIYGVFVYTPRYYVQLKVDTVEVNDIVRKLP